MNNHQDNWIFATDSINHPLEDALDNLNTLDDIELVNDVCSPIEQMELFQSLLATDASSKDQAGALHMQPGDGKKRVLESEEGSLGTEQLQHQSRKQKRIVKETKPFVIEYRPRSKHPKKASQSKKTTVSTCHVPPFKQTPIIQSKLPIFQNCEQLSQNSTIVLPLFQIELEPFPDKTPQKQPELTFDYETFIDLG